jgi:hypothetical protein
MDNKTFDSLLKLSATSTGRRRLFQAAAAVGVGGLLTRGVAGAREVVIQACEPLQATCERDRQCQCNGTGERERECRRELKRGCRRDDGKKRCCGVRDSSCNKDCDCCPGYRCNESKGKCVT